MAWDVNQIFSLLKFLLNKNQAGSISATDFFFTWNTEQSAYQSDLLGKWQARNNGKSGANTGLILNETLLTELTPFTHTIDLLIISGQATRPDDFIYQLALRKDGAKVLGIKHGQIASVNDSVIDPPSVADNKYYAVEYENLYSILPDTTTGNLTLDYISTCPDIVWGFTLDGNGRQVYDVVTSVQPLWDQNSIVQITKRSLKSLGVHFKDQDFSQFGQSNVTTGD